MSDYLGKEEELIMTIITDQSEYFINVGESMLSSKGSLFKTKDSIIKFGLFKGKEHLGIGEFVVNNEMHWIAISINSSKKNKDTNTQSFKKDIRLRIKCSFVNGHSSQSAKLSCNGPSLEDKSISDQSKPYLKPKIGKLFHNQICNSNISKLLNTEINSSRKTNTINKEDQNKQCKTQRGDNDDISLSLLLSKDKFDYQTRTAQKKIKSNSYYIPPQSNNELEEQIIDKAYENNIKNDEMIMNSASKSNDCTDENLFKQLDDIDDSLNAFKVINNDFVLLYEDASFSDATNETIQLEAELFIEKCSQVQLKYHHSMNKIKEQIDYYKTMINEIHSLYSNIIKKKNKLDIKLLKNDSYDIHNGQIMLSYNKLKLYNDEMKLWSTILVKSINNSKEKQKKNLKEKLTKALLNDVILCLFSKDKQLNLIDNLNVYQKFFLNKIINNATSSSLLLCKTQRDSGSAINKKELLTIQTTISPLIETNPNRMVSSLDCFPINLSCGNIQTMNKRQDSKNKKTIKRINQRSKFKYFSVSKYR